MTPARARLVLVGVVLLVFGRLALCDFTWWDDENTITQNPDLNPVTAASFLTQWTRPSGKIYVPLTYTVWSALTFVARVPADPTGVSLNPPLFHVVNVLAHVGGALAAFALLRRLVRHDTAALLGALLWAVHPVQVESVGWVSGLKDVLSGTLVLTALTAFVAWRQDGRRWRYAAALALYALALLAKPSAFTMPLLVLVLDRLVLGTPWRRAGAALVPLAVLTLPIALIARASQPPLPLDPIAPWLRPLVAGDALAFYLVKTAVPVALSVDYGRTIGFIRQNGQLWYAWLLPAAFAGAAAWTLRRRDPLPFTAFLLFVLAPVHVLGLTAFDFEIMSTVADHYLYVALIGPALLLAWAVARRPAWAAAAAVLVGVYGARAAWQTPVWQDTDTLFAHALTVNPRSWSSHTILAASASRRGDRATERRELEAAVALDPPDPNCHIGLLELDLAEGDDAGAKTQADRVVATWERFWGERGAQTAPAFEAVAGTYLNAGRPDGAAPYVREGLARLPTDLMLQRYARQIAWMPRTPPATARRP